jgi:Zn-dependent M28 family amino/carboxypeptidase
MTADPKMIKMKPILVGVALPATLFLLASVRTDIGGMSVQEKYVRAHLEFLASDALQGRGSGSQYELIAAQYIASQLRQFGVAPAGNLDASAQRTFLQTVAFAKHALAELPRTNFDAEGKTAEGTHGKEIVLAPAATAEINHTWNVVGVLKGGDPKLANEAILLSAHIDHLGVMATASDDSIFNGADDDASGVAAVLELARILNAGPELQRTVYFVLFGGEERGGFGSQHFIENSPVPLSNIIADLQFEMIGRPDSKVAANTLWLTGFDRSNLGPELAKHGARLVADPRPEENFFERSDNYRLAKRGVIAHTVSSYGMHPEYHQPNDDVAHIDFVHMSRAINAMIKPIRWLANSSFTPAWAEGKKP